MWKSLQLLATTLAYTRRKGERGTSIRNHIAKRKKRGREKGKTPAAKTYQWRMALERRGTDEKLLWLEKRERDNGGKSGNQNKGRREDSRRGGEKKGKETKEEKEHEKQSRQVWERRNGRDREVGYPKLKKKEREKEKERKKGIRVRREGKETRETRECAKLWDNWRRGMKVWNTEREKKATVEKECRERSLVRNAKIRERPERHQTRERHGKGREVRPRATLTPTR